MNNDVIAVALECLGFKEARQEDVQNYHIPYCRYLYRVHKGQHQYVWLTSYDNKFVESVIEIFRVPRNSRAKYNPKIVAQELSGFRTLHCGLARNLEDILAQLDVVYLTAEQREELERKREEERKQKEKTKNA